MDIILITFLFRLLDNAFSTAKTVYLHKGKYVLSALLNTVSTFFYLVAMVNIIKDNSIGGIVAMCAATFLGTLLPARIIDRLEKDKLFVYEITADNMESGLKFAKEVSGANLAIKTMVAKDSSSNEVLNCKVYCTTKSESLMLKDIIPDKFKYHAYAAKEY